MDELFTNILTVVFHYAGDLVIVCFQVLFEPSLAENIGVLRGKASGYAARGGGLNRNEKIALLNGITHMNDVMYEVAHSMEIAFAENARIEKDLKADYDQVAL